MYRLMHPGDKGPCSPPAAVSDSASPPAGHHPRPATHRTCRKQKTQRARSINLSESKRSWVISKRSRTSKGEFVKARSIFVLTHSGAQSKA